MTGGVYDMLQLAVPVVVPARVHVGAGVKVPVELVVNMTVPVGVVAPVVEVSVTIAAQVVATLSWTDEGLHETVVVVGCGGGGGVEVTSRVKVPELVAWVESPG